MNACSSDGWTSERREIFRQLKRDFRLVLESSDHNQSERHNGGGSHLDIMISVIIISVDW